MKINSKKKGNRYENLWANWLRDNGVKAYKDGASGGGTREKSDVGNDIDYSFQVTAGKKIPIQKKWRQAIRDAEMVHDTPCLVIHFDGMAEDQFLVVLNNYDWLKAIKGDKIEIGDTQNDRERRHTLENLKYAIGRALKVLE